MKTLLLTAATVLLSATSLMAQSLSLQTPWLRATPPNGGVSAGYVTITNSGDTADHLLSAYGNFVDRIEVHTVEKDGDVMRMRRVEGGIEIKPGESAVLAPGGQHLMLMGLTERLIAGETKAVVLEFARSGRQLVSIPVLPISHNGENTALVFQQLGVTPSIQALSSGTYVQPAAAPAPAAPTPAPQPVKKKKKPHTHDHDHSHSHSH